MPTPTAPDCGAPPPWPPHRPRASRWLAWLAVALLAGAGCSPSGDGPGAGRPPAPAGPATTATATTGQVPASTPDPTTPRALAGEVCAALPDLPYIERVELLDELDTEVRTAVASSCADDVALVDEIGAVAERAARLDDNEQFFRGLGMVECNETRLVVRYRNTLPYAFRLIVVGEYESEDGSVLSSAWTVTGPVSPDEAVAVEVPYRGLTDPGDFGCTANVQGFLELDREVTDTWTDGPTGTESGPSPDPVEPDPVEMTAIIERLVRLEAETAASGDWARAGIFEDVRSDNYPGLVTSAARYETFEPAEIVRICSMDDLSDQLRAVVWEEVDAGSDPDPDAGEGLTRAVLGVFHRSALDGRWRWVHTAVRLDLVSSCVATASDDP